MKTTKDSSSTSSSSSSSIIDGTSHYSVELFSNFAVMKRNNTLFDIDAVINTIIPAIEVLSRTSREFFISKIHPFISTYALTGSGSGIELQRVLDDYRGRVLLALSLSLKPESAEIKHKPEISFSVSDEGVRISNVFKHCDGSFHVDLGKLAASFTGTLRQICSVGACLLEEFPNIVVESKSFQRETTLSVRIRKVPKTIAAGEDEELLAKFNADLLSLFH